jgi:hypothetical protein
MLPNWPEIKDVISQTTGLSHPALHVILGLAIYGLVLAALRCELRNPLPWLILLVLECGNEVIDQFVGAYYDGSPDFAKSGADMAITMLLPTVVLLCGMTVRNGRTARTEHRRVPRRPVNRQ